MRGQSRGLSGNTLDRHRMFQNQSSEKGGAHCGLRMSEAFCREGCRGRGSEPIARALERHEVGDCNPVGRGGTPGGGHPGTPPGVHTKLRNPC